MLHFNKLFKLPGPKDLGMSDSNNAMPSEYFRNNKEEYTWENYYARIKKEYPAKFFFASTVPQFFRDCWLRFSRPCKDAHYWLVSHTIRQYHWLDLRQPKVDYFSYRYGWVEADTQMEYALFNILSNFVENQTKYSHYYVPSEEDAAKDDGVDYNYFGFKEQLANHKELMTIYNWWKKDYHEELAEHDHKLTEWSNARQAFADNKEDLWKELVALDKRNSDKLDEMLIRLIKIRRTMWT